LPFLILLHTLPVLFLTLLLLGALLFLILLDTLTILFPTLLLFLLILLDALSILLPALLLFSLLRGALRLTLLLLRGSLL